MREKAAARSYDARGRERKAEENRIRVVDTAIALLRDGDAEFSLRKLAKASDCSERHLYRMFGGLEGLAHALNDRMNLVLGIDGRIQDLEVAELPRYARQLFDAFSRNERLVEAYMDSPVGRASREIWLQEKAKMVESAFVGRGIGAAHRREILLILSVSLWRVLRTEAGMPADEATRYVGRLAEELVRNVTKERGEA